MENTLRIFQSAASYGNLQASGLPTPSQILAIFDPHDHDCAFHIRTQMLYDLTRLYGAPEK
jgi:hypothetical protein